MFYPKSLDIVPCAMQRTLLLIHSKCNSLYLLTPNSLSLPLLPPFPWQPQKSVLPVCELETVEVFNNSHLQIFMLHNGIKLLRRPTKDLTSALNCVVIGSSGGYLFVAFMRQKWKILLAYAEQDDWSEMQRKVLIKNTLGPSQRQSSSVFWWMVWSKHSVSWDLGDWPTIPQASLNFWDWRERQ